MMWVIRAGQNALYYDKHILNSRVTSSKRNLIGEIPKADTYYIDSLANIQRRLEKQPDTKLLENHWVPSMCLDTYKN